MNGIEVRFPPTKEGVNQAQRVADIEGNVWWEHYVNWGLDASDTDIGPSGTDNRLAVRALLLAAQDNPELFEAGLVQHAEDLL